MIDVPDMRQCKRCGVWEPRDEHHFAPIRKGHPTLRRECRRCQSQRACARDRANRADPVKGDAYRARRAATARTYAQANPDKIHEWQRNDRESVKQDPERKAARLAKNRAAYHQRMHRRARFGKEWWDEPDYEPLVTTSGGMVDAAAFLDFARDVYPNANPQELARLFRMDGTGARRVFTGEHKRISLAVLDRALTEGLGRPDLLDTLYPEAML